MVILTRELLEKYATNKIGFTYDQMRALGVPVPPKNGWLKGMIGKEVTQEQFDLFCVSGRMAGGKKDKRKRKAAISKDTPERLKYNLLNSVMELEAARARIEKNANLLFAACGNDEIFSVKHSDVDISSALIALQRAGIKKFDYNDEAYRGLRHLVFVRHGEKCCKCGFVRAEDGSNWLEIDHIKPVSKFPWLSLNIENLQVLCKKCNKEKSNKDFTDYREEK